MKYNVDDLKSELKQSRDELKLKSHLFQKEVKDLWEKAEEKWNDYENGLNKLKKNTVESGQGISAALDLLKEEIVDSYDKIKRSI